MKRKIIYYNPRLKKIAQWLRNNSTRSEIKLWENLKEKQMFGYDFHRQKPLLNFIVDFYCYELNLVIELDGYSHQFNEILMKNQNKQDQLERLGLNVLRFDDDEVMNEINNVLNEIEGYITLFEKG